MTHIVNIITPDRVVNQSTAKSKNEVIKLLSELFSKSATTLNTTQLFNAFIAREELGSTALGHGVAIPHIRSNTATQPLGAFVQLKRSIDFDAEDLQPVDIIFALVVPTDQDNEHLNLLAEISQLFASESFRHQVRLVTSHRALFDALITPEHHANCA